jgi:hypothetical protein
MYAYMIPRANDLSTMNRSSFSSREDSKVSVKDTIGRRVGLFSRFYFIINIIYCLSGRGSDSDESQSLTI